MTCQLCNGTGIMKARFGVEAQDGLNDTYVGDPYPCIACRVYPNGAPMFAPDGMMLDEHGNRSIFDDVDC